MARPYRRAVVWAEDSYDFAYFSYTAPILHSGSVDWDNADEINKWPARQRAPGGQSRNPDPLATAIPSLPLP